MMTAMNCSHLLPHRDIDHFHHYFGMIRKQKKWFEQMKHFYGSTCLILFNVDNTISTVTDLNKATVLQLSTNADNGFVHGC